MNTADKVRNVVAKSLGLELDQVSATASFRDLGADSLEDMMIVIDLEDAFGITIPDDDLDSIQTVADAITIVERSMS